MRVESTPQHQNDCTEVKSISAVIETVNPLAHITVRGEAMVVAVTLDIMNITARQKLHKYEHKDSDLSELNNDCTNLGQSMCLNALF